jgi:hypothetical protein
LVAVSQIGFAASQGKELQSFDHKAYWLQALVASRIPPVTSSTPCDLKFQTASAKLERMVRVVSHSKSQLRGMQVQRCGIVYVSPQTSEQCGCVMVHQILATEPAIRMAWVELHPEQEIKAKVGLPRLAGAQ